jgi:hypothetical protein
MELSIDLNTEVNMKKESRVMLLQKPCLKWNISFRKSWSLVLPFVLMSFLATTGAWGAQVFTISPDATHISYIPGEGVGPPTTGQYTMLRTGTTASTTDACNSNPPALGSLTGKVALIRRGTCTFLEKINNAKTAGAVGVVIYNSIDSGLTIMGLTDTATIPAVFISMTDGAIIDTRLQSGPVNMTWTNLVTYPVISSVTSTTADGTYGLGSEINVKLNFNEPVTITDGALSVVLNSGAILKPSASLSTSIVSATYTVQANERTTDLTVTRITGTITNIEAVSTVNPTIPAGKNLGDTKNIVIIQKFPWPMFLPAITTAVQ